MKSNQIFVIRTKCWTKIECVNMVSFIESIHLWSYLIDKSFPSVPGWWRWEICEATSPFRKCWRLEYLENEHVDYEGTYGWIQPDSCSLYALHAQVENLFGKLQDLTLIDPNYYVTPILTSFYFSYNWINKKLFAHTLAVLISND